MLKTKVKLLDPKAEVPTRAYDTDSGYDLKMIGVKKIEGDVIFFKTGVSVQPPDGYYFEIFPRSSISGLPLQLANSVGVCDQSYRGELIVPLRLMHSEMGRDVKNISYPNGIVNMFGTKPSSMMTVADLILKNKPILCQLVLKKRYDTEFELVDQLDETTRGEGGFGSTDKK